MLRHPHRIRSIQSRTIRLPHLAITALDIETLPGKAWHDLSSERSTLSILLGQIGGRAEPRLHLNRPAAGTHTGLRHANYVPTDTTVWGYTENLRSLRDLRISFDFARLAEALDEDVDTLKAAVPLLMLSDPRVFAVGELLFAECSSPDDLSPLYAEGLVTALLMDLLRLGRHPATVAMHGALAPWQLRRATAFMDANLAEPISLAGLASLTGLSASRFGRGFKASTGVTPHQWLLNARVRRAQDLLLKDDLPMADVALASGFSEQSHFNRTFRRLTGCTPGQWRRDRGGRRVSSIRRQ